MLQPTEQERVDILNSKLDEIRKTVKAYQRYMNESNTDFESHNKRLQSLCKQYLGQIVFTKDDPLSLETVQLLECSAKTFLQQSQEFHIFSQGIHDDYNEKANGYSKRIYDFSQNNLKTLQLARSNYQKARQKYEKLCKELDSIRNSNAKSSNDALSGYHFSLNISNRYNVELTNKNDTRLRDIIKSVEQAEQMYKDSTEAANLKNKDFSEGLQESQKQLRLAYKYSTEKMLEITMKLDQHNLLAFNWIKGFLDEKGDKITQVQKISSDDEDVLIQMRQDTGQSNIRYIDIMNRLLNDKEKQSISDSEYIQFPDILQRHLDFQLNMISDRVKNLKTLSHFFGEVIGLYDQLQKNVNKAVKQVFQSIQVMFYQSVIKQEKLQETGENKQNVVYTKKLVQIQELLAQFHEGYSKKLYQLLQFLQMKQTNLETLLKDQKAQEKSFQNMYSKMIKDIIMLRNQLTGTGGGAESEQKQTNKEALNIQLKKLIKESAPIIKYSLEQIRSVENLRGQSVSNILDGFIQQYLIYTDETIKQIKVFPLTFFKYNKLQEESLNKKFDLIEQDMTQLPNLNFEKESQEFQYIKTFEMTDELQKMIDLTNIEIAKVQDDDEDDRNLEEGAVKVSQKLLEKFRIAEGERCLASYACAFENKILLQGRMYIFTNKICFHSYFNSKTIFGTTALAIPANEINQVKKLKAYLIDAAIEFKTNKGVLLFTSFVNREHTIGQIKNVKGLAECIMDETTKEVKRINNQEPQIQQQEPILPQVSPMKEQFNDLVIEQVKEVPRTESLSQNQQLKQQIQLEHKVQSEVFPVPDDSTAFYNMIMVHNKLDRYQFQPKVTKFTIELEMSVEEFANNVLMDKDISSAGQNYLGFQHYYQLAHCKDKDIVYEKYQPQPSWDKPDQVFKRTINFLHPVREKVMFTPEFAGCSAADSLYLLNRNEVLHEKDVSFSKIPYGDHFKCRTYWHAKSKPEGSKGCLVEYGFYVLFVKKTVWQTKIENSSKAENTECWEKGLKILLLEEEKNLKERLVPQQQAAPSLIKVEVEKQVEEIKNSEVQQLLPKPAAIVNQKVVENQPMIVETQKFVPPHESELEKKIDKLMQLVMILIALVSANILINIIN